VSVVDILANATTPTGVTTFTVYDENAGSPTEYNLTESTSGSRIDLGATDDPDLNSVHIKGTSVQNNDKITFTPASAVGTLNLTSLNFRIKNTAAVAYEIGIVFYNGIDPISNVALRLVDGLYGYLTSNIITYQSIGVPVSDILFSDSEFTHFVFTFFPVGTGTVEGVSIDNVRLNYGEDISGLSGADTFLGLNDVFEETYEGKAGYSPVVNQLETGNIFERLPKFQDLFTTNQNIIGGVIPLGGLDYQVWSSLYIINSIVYPDVTYPGEVRDDVTISPADATFDRYVVFYVENDGVSVPTVGFIEGTAAANPLIPIADLDLSKQVLIGWIRVTANGGSGTPSEITIDAIYLENAGEPAEWTIINTPVGVNVADTTISYQGTNSILVPAGSPVGILKFQNDVPVPYDPNGFLNFAVKLDTNFKNGGTIGGPSPNASIWKISVRDNTLGVTSTFWAGSATLQSSGMTLTNTTDWQLLQFSMDNYSLNAYPEFAIDEVWFEFVRTPKVNFDNIQLQSGINVSTGPLPEYTLSPISANIFSLLKDGIIVASIDLTPYADQNAAEVPVADAGGYYTATDVEGVLQEIALTIISGIAGFRKKTVINIVDNTAVPPTEVSGDRYILDFTGASHANWDGAAAGDIVQFNGTTWDNFTPEEGWVAYVDALNADYRFVDDGSPTWEEIISGLQNVVEDLTPQSGGIYDTNSFMLQLSKGADVASASALPILQDGNSFNITGNETITSINTTGKVGTVIKLRFDDVLTLTHHATDLILPTGANIVTQAGDEAEFLEYASGDFRCTGYLRADGTALAGSGGTTALSTGTVTNTTYGITSDGGADDVILAQAVASTSSGVMSGTDKAKLDGIEAGADVTDAVNVGSSMTGATAKTTPVDADTMPLNDSADSNLLKKVTWANIKATLKTYLDTLYKPLADRLEEDATVTGTKNIDWSLYETFRYTLTGACTFSDTNLPASGTKTITIHMDGNFAPTYPAGWTTYIRGTYDGAVRNLITVEYVKAGTPFYVVDISQPD
jgi:hypothetical protein